MNFFTTRLNYLYAFLCIVTMFVIAFYLQFAKGIDPCPLCILQRITAGLLGICFFFGASLSLKKVGRCLVGGLAFIFSAVGILLAGRQVWLQHLPPNTSSDCGASLNYMLHVLPLDQVFQKILEGSSDCSRMEWSLFGLSLAEWSLLWFVIFAIFSLWQMRNPKITS